MGKGFNFVSEDVQEQWNKKRVVFEDKLGTWYGIVNGFIPDEGIEIIWDTTDPTGSMGICLYRNVKGTLNQLRLL